MNLSDPDGTDAIPRGGGYIYTLRPGLDPRLLAGVKNNWVHNDRGNLDGQCAVAGEFLAGGFVNGAVHDVPNHDTWRQGDAVGANTDYGTLIATGWQAGEYPSLDPTTYRDTYPGSPTNHVGIFLEYTGGQIWILDQSTGRALSIDPKDPSGWYVITVPRKSDGPYDKSPSESYLRAQAKAAGLREIQRFGAAGARLIYGSIDGLAFAGSIDGFQTWNGIGDLPIGGMSPSDTEATAQP